MTEPTSADATDAPRRRVLTINGGSSSLKFAAFDLPADGAHDATHGEAHHAPRRRLAGKVERIGLPDAVLTVTAPGGVRDQAPVVAPDHAAAMDRAFDELSRRDPGRFAAVGHRVVHGGPRFDRPEPVTLQVVAELRRLAPLDPEHLPAEITLIEWFERRLPGVPQLACFDTAFHRDMPRVARVLALPRRFEALGVRRYGFHGLSYEYLMEALARAAGPRAARGRVVLAHLGGGASLAAVRDGRGIDTSMGLTPAAGLPMGTRSGDIDPGLPGYLARTAGLSPEQFDHLVHHESGLLGVSETTPDMRDLLARRATDARAAEAVDLFCYQLKKWIGAYAAVLGGLDTLVFSGGVGENSPAVRAAACEGLAFLGVRLDESRNAANAPVVSRDGAAATVRVIATDEELVIARALGQMISAGAGG